MTVNHLTNRVERGYFEAVVDEVREFLEIVVYGDGKNQPTILEIT